MKFSIQVKEEIVRLVLSVQVYPDMRALALDLVQQGLSRLLPSKNSVRDQIWSDVNELCEHPPVDGQAPVASYMQAVAKLRLERPETQRLLDILVEAGFEPTLPGSAGEERFVKPDLTAIQYARVHREARQRVQELRTLAKRLRLKSFEQRAASLLEALRAELYRVTITGKSRAGKSTLLNQLIGRDICPAKRFLTTSVPIVIGPGENERIRVKFGRGKPHTLDGPITADMLRPYADHEFNPRNEKDVESIEVWLAGSVLDLGVEYVDIPGIDDPSGTVWKRAREVVEEAHALVIVIDVAPHAVGGLTIDRQVRELVEAACRRDAPVFIVGNKADFLGREQREEVRALMRSQLLELGLPVDDLRGPYILSASHGGEGCDDHVDLVADYDRFDRDLWQHLWHNHDIGLRRLQAIFEHVGSAAHELAAIFAVRDKSEPERVELRTAMAGCEAEQTHVLSTIDAVVERHIESIGKRFEAIHDDVPAEVAAAMESGEGPLDMESIEARLRVSMGGRLAAVGDEVVKELASELTPLYQQADRSLAQLREQIGISREVQAFHEMLTNLEVRLTGLSGASREKWRRWLGRGAILGGTLLGGALLFSNPLTALGAAAATTTSWSIVEWLGRAPASHEGLRGQAEASVADVLGSAESDMARQIRAQVRTLKGKLEHHMAPFLDDVRERLLDLQPPSDEERSLHEQMQGGVEQVLRTLVDALEDCHELSAVAPDSPAV